MQSSSLTIVAALLLTFPAAASAQLRVTQPSVNLGELRGGPVYAHRFEFTNDSSQPLEILDFHLGCGCLQPLIDKRTFQPGEKGSLLMNLRTLGQSEGERAWRAQVHYRVGDKKAECPIVVSARLRNEITVEPSILAMTIETTLRQEILIKDQRKTPLTINQVLASTPAIHVTKQPTIDGVTKIIVEVSRSALSAPKQNESLTIYTDDPHYRSLQVPITLTQAQSKNVSASPESISLVGNDSQLVRLRGSNDQRVRVEKADADHRAIRCTFLAGPGNDSTLKIAIDAALLTSSSALGTVTVRFAEPAGASLTIPVLIRKD